ncbi:MAG: tRNA uridine-5-carboxymethylaminomethyl(34) synthesis GTPase MnmE [Desulfovibrionaceae bacterium]
MTAPRDTIAAAATPPGRGGLAVLRVSGPGALAAAARVFTPTRPGPLAPWRLRHGRLADAEGRPLDEALAAYMPGPRSYTGEDVVELSCHGGPAVVAAALAALHAAGARPAERGEFTRRAFLNGRLDLTQAEAVAELIHAPTRAAGMLAQAKLSGVLGGRIQALRQRLDGLRAQLCLAVDFPEDEAECLPPEALRAEVAACMADLDGLLAGFRRARVWREGAAVVLCGRVNAGKSSLMNSLLGRNRAIVSPEPGTTRDYIEEALDLDGLAVRLIDTAGLRPARGEAERAGLELGGELAARADLVLWVVDAARPGRADAPDAPEADTPDIDNSDAGSLGTAPSDIDSPDADLAAAAVHGPGRVLVAANKMDLTAAAENMAAGGAGSATGDAGPAPVLAAAGYEVLPVSARTGLGLEALADRLRERLLGAAAEPDPDEAAPNARQADLLARARAELAALAADAATGTPPDLLGVRLDTACALLSDITGQSTPDEILNAIFDAFCIGK